jgi:serine/threonine protein kinase
MFASKRSWVVKLIDFGRARSIDSLSTANAIGKSTILAGDGQRFAEWTAPEILRLSHRSSGKENNNTATTTAKPPPPASESLTPQTDMWGLGLITFCLYVLIFRIHGIIIRFRIESIFVFV